MRKISMIMSLAFLIFLAPSTFGVEVPNDNPCSTNEASQIIVDTQSEVLLLCSSGQVQGKYDVAIGRKGVGKQKEGDKKTPLGEYSLGVPRASKRFHIFIPVGYPTADQKAEGLTGGDIGVHGPWRPLSWLGRLTTWVDWTQGCIAVGKKTEIEEIARWVKESNAKDITIR